MVIRCLSSIENIQVEIIPNKENEMTTPSCVAF